VGVRVAISMHNTQHKHTQRLAVEVTAERARLTAAAESLKNNIHVAALHTEKVFLYTQCVCVCVCVCVAGGGGFKFYKRNETTFHYKRNMKRDFTCLKWLSATKYNLFFKRPWRVCVCVCVGVYVCVCVCVCVQVVLCVKGESMSAM